MGRLRRALTGLFPAESLLPGLRIGKGKRVFSIRLHEGEEAVGFNLDGLRNWPDGRKRCDGLFLCLPSHGERFVVILVELKGNHVEHALEQIKDTCLLLCERSNDILGVHSKSKVIGEFQPLLSGHGAHLFGFIVATQSMSLRQEERAKLRRELGIKVKFARRAEGVDCRDLAGNY